MNKRISVDEIAAMTASAKHRILAAKSPDEIHVISVIELPVTDVEVYDKNPRHHDNPKYEEIKESIRIRGLESALYITKRPGTNRYILARGGKTRLKALQELARENPQKWGKLNFHEVPWISESEILAAHLVENIGRSEMCFWDVAEGLTTLKAEIEKETGKPVSTRSLPELLKSRGVEATRDLVVNSEFAVGFLRALGSWKESLGYRDVHLSLRPKFSALQDLWLLNRDKTKDSFQALCDQVVGACVQQHPEYSLELLVAEMVGSMAPEFGCSRGALLAALHAHQESAIRDLQDLQALLQAKEQTLAQQARSEEGSGHAQDEPPTVELGLGGTTQPPLAKPPQNEGLQNLQRTIDQARSRATDVPGIPGVSVVQGLTPRPPKVPAQRGAQGQGMLSLHGGPLNAQELMALEREGQEGLARRVLWDALQDFGDEAGIAELITPSQSPALAYGFYMELPEPGKLGASLDDIAVQAWWLLAGLSEQGQPHVAERLIDPQTGQIVSEAIRQGPGTFSTIILDAQAFENALRERLGGQPVDLAVLLLHILTERRSPLHQVTLALIDACANWKACRGVS